MMGYFSALGSLAITFITPHQLRNSGGVYTIEQFAREWSDHGRSTLLVTGDETRPVPGVDVIAAPDANLEQAPDADAVLIPADLGHTAPFEAPPEKGVPLVFFQGYGDQGNPDVLANLSRAGRALCGAEWLVNEAKALGCKASLVRYGLDRKLFEPGPPNAQRDRIVAMMTHHYEWKGTDDGLQALALARERDSRLQIRLFGKVDVAEQLPGATFLPAPPAGRLEIGSLLREAALFVCPSWEEGFGLPGLEAIECGAALATTDTKGSRDYAVDGETALVSPPKDPVALAERITALTNDAELRERLVKQGQSLARLRYPDWPEATVCFGDAVEQLIQ
jgi:glycosyltransferase involved in cell wall biosynthesis